MARLRGSSTSRRSPSLAASATHEQASDREDEYEEDIGPVTPIEEIPYPLPGEEDDQDQPSSPSDPPEYYGAAGNSAIRARTRSQQVAAERALPPGHRGFEIDEAEQVTPQATDADWRPAFPPRGITARPLNGVRYTSPLGPVSSPVSAVSSHAQSRPSPVPQSTSPTQARPSPVPQLPSRTQTRLSPIPQSPSAAQTRPSPVPQATSPIRSSPIRPTRPSVSPPGRIPARPILSTPGNVRALAARSQRLRAQRRSSALRSQTPLTSPPSRGPGDVPFEGRYPSPGTQLQRELDATLRREEEMRRRARESAAPTEESDDSHIDDDEAFQFRMRARGVARAAARKARWDEEEMFEDRFLNGIDGDDVEDHMHDHAERISPSTYDEVPSKWTYDEPPSDWDENYDVTPRRQAPVAANNPPSSPPGGGGGGATVVEDRTPSLPDYPVSEDEDDTPYWAHALPFGPDLNELPRGNLPELRELPYDDEFSDDDNHDDYIVRRMALPLPGQRGYSPGYVTPHVPIPPSSSPSSSPASRQYSDPSPSMINVNRSSTPSRGPPPTPAPRSPRANSPPISISSDSSSDLPGGSHNGSDETEDGNRHGEDQDDQEDHPSEDDEEQDSRDDHEEESDSSRGSSSTNENFLPFDPEFRRNEVGTLDYGPGTPRSVLRDQYEQQLEQLRDQHEQQLADLRDQYEQQFEQLREQLRDTREADEAFMTELNEEIIAQDAEIARLTAALEECEEHRRARRAELDRMGERIDALDDQPAERSPPPASPPVHDDVWAIVDGLNNELDDVHDAREMEREECMTRVEELQAELELAYANNDNVDFQQDLEDLESPSPRPSDRAARQANLQATRLREENAAVRQDNANLREEMADLRAQNERINREREHLRLNAQRPQAEIAQENANLREVNVTYHRQNDRINQENFTLRLENQTLAAQVTEVDNTLREVDEEGDETAFRLRGQLEATQQTLATANANLAHGIGLLHEALDWRRDATHLLLVQGIWLQWVYFDRFIQPHENVFQAVEDGVPPEGADLQDVRERQVDHLREEIGREEVEWLEEAFGEDVDEPFVRRQLVDGRIDWRQYGHLQTILDASPGRRERGGAAAPSPSESSSGTSSESSSSSDEDDGDEGDEQDVESVEDDDEEDDEEDSETEIMKVDNEVDSPRERAPEREYIKEEEQGNDGEDVDENNADEEEVDEDEDEDEDVPTHGLPVFSPRVTRRPNRLPRTEQDDQNDLDSPHVRFAGGTRFPRERFSDDEAQPSEDDYLSEDPDHLISPSSFVESEPSPSPYVAARSFRRPTPGPAPRRSGRVTLFSLRGLESRGLTRNPTPPRQVDAEEDDADQERQDDIPSSPPKKRRRREATRGRTADDEVAAPPSASDGEDASSSSSEEPDADPSPSRPPRNANRLPRNALVPVIDRSEITRNADGSWTSTGRSTRRVTRSGGVKRKRGGK
ncbi:unnamed protein product [Zymoseptoria tritici ST99CH_3D7]|uniref:Uncharacterized protein n=1 Tax=Zymoseptoria tritici (strain ST99CH_3D7) TaxID=1276538 RepID=A0A1X7RQW6_ZYMT9|nr:unnamed protein product [Zymoseptoria tritici ST99CH_3D7]